MENPCKNYRKENRVLCYKLLREGVNPKLINIVDLKEVKKEYGFENTIKIYKYLDRFTREKRGISLFVAISWIYNLESYEKEFLFEYLDFLSDEKILHKIEKIGAFTLESFLNPEPRRKLIKEYGEEGVKLHLDSLKAYLDSCIEFPRLTYIDPQYPHLIPEVLEKTKDIGCVTKNLIKIGKTLGVEELSDMISRNQLDELLEGCITN